MNDCTAPFVCLCLYMRCMCCKLACVFLHVCLKDDRQFCIIVTFEPATEDECRTLKTLKHVKCVCRNVCVAGGCWCVWEYVMQPTVCEDHGASRVCAWPSLHFTSICRAQGEEFQPILERSDPCQTRLHKRLKRQWVHLYTHTYTCHFDTLHIKITAYNYWQH